MKSKKLNFIEYKKIVDECLELSKIKNADYGTLTIKRFMEKGIVIRMYDKMERMINLIWENRDIKVKDEKIEDTVKDMINYAIYLIMILRNKLEE